MKKIYQLKTILDIVIVFSMLVMALSLLGLLYGLVTGNMSKLNITIADQKVAHFSSGITFLALFIAAGYGLFIYSIYELKKLIAMFVRKEFFTDASVESLKKIGVSMLMSSFLVVFPAYVYGLLHDATTPIMISSIKPDSMAFSIIISLFFIILSYIFNEAKLLKEENELTV